ncbi:MAG: manganese catalase family protein [Clostridia bacterium]|nr:manganese catalase family protein [Clostridia bacterium]
MWDYNKKLIYPVHISQPDPAMAKLIITQLGGPDGELGAATRYLTQRFTQPYAQGKAILTDIGTAVSEMFPIRVSCFFRLLQPYISIDSAAS